MKLKAKSSKLEVKLGLIVLFSAFTFCLSPVANASFMDIGLGPRALGMGSAFTALADDATASYYNPAGLGQLMEKEIGLSYASLYPGLSYPTGRADIGDGFLSYVHPLSEEMGVFGISWINRHASDLYAENSYIISYGRGINEGIYFGVNIKILQMAYSRSQWSYDETGGPGTWGEGGDDPLFTNGTSAMGMSLDIGLLLNISEELRVGVCLKDINQPDISLQHPDSTKTLSSPVPMSIKMGANYEMGEYRILADMTVRNYDYFVNAGFEWWMTELPIAIRGGLGCGSRSYLEASAGASYLIMPMSGPLMYQFDYAFLYSLGGLEGTLGSHRLGLTIRIR